MFSLHARLTLFLWVWMLDPAYCEEFVVKAQNRQAQIQLYGKIEALHASNLASEIPGKVLTTYFQAGDFVKKDQILAKLDRGSLDSELKIQEWELKETRLSEDYHQQRLERRRSNPKAYTQEEIQTEEFTLGRLKITRGKIQSRIAEIQRNLSLTLIKAPYDGVLSTKFLNIGEWVQRGQILFLILSIDKTMMELEVSRRFFNLVQNGDLLEIDLQGRKVSGIIRSKIPKSNPNLGTLPLRVELPLRIGEVSHGEILPVTIRYDEKIIQIPPPYFAVSGKTFRVMVFGKEGLEEISLDGQLEGSNLIPFDLDLAGQVLQKIEK